MVMPRKDDGKTKVCKSCSIEKPLSEYFCSGGYYTPRCKPCHNEWCRMQRNSPEGKSTYASWASSDRGKKVISARMKKWRTKNQQKRAAQTAVSNAIRDGRLIRKACNICGSGDPEAHHADYAKPLEVRWLCKAHHVEEHYAFLPSSDIE